MNFIARLEFELTQYDIVVVPFTTSSRDSSLSLSLSLSLLLYFYCDNNETSDNIYLLFKKNDLVSYPICGGLSKYTWRFSLSLYLSIYQSIYLSLSHTHTFTRIFKRFSLPPYFRKLSRSQRRSNIRLKTISTVRIINGVFFLFGHGGFTIWKNKMYSLIGTLPINNYSRHIFRLYSCSSSFINKRIIQDPYGISTPYAEIWFICKRLTADVLPLETHL